MAKIVPTQTTFLDGRFALMEDGVLIGYGHLEVPFVPPTSDGAILSDVQFILEPRSEDRSNEQLMRAAHS